jgi:hypothetical protein
MKNSASYSSESILDQMQMGNAKHFTCPNKFLGRKKLKSNAHAFSMKRKFVR